MKKLSAILLLCLLACSSAELVENWKNPDIILFNANKVLLVGMTQNEEARNSYETLLHKEFKERGVESMRSMDLFDVEFTSSKRSEEELGLFEQSLLDKGFDAVLFTKVIGTESVANYQREFDDLNSYSGGFEEDYYRHQNIYYDTEYYNDYTIYHAETSLYCICEGKARELIWRGAIDITDPIDVQKTINDYVVLLLAVLEEQDLIFITGFEEDSAS